MRTPNSRVSASTLAAETGSAGTSAYGDHIDASNREGTLVAAAAAVGLGADVDLKNETVSGSAAVAVVGVIATGRDNRVSAGTLAAGTGIAGTRAYGDRGEASNRNGTDVAAAAAGSIGATDVNLKNGLENAAINGVDAEGALVGVAAVDSERNAIRAGTLAAGTGIAGTGAYGDRIEAHNDEGFVVVVAASGGLGGDVTLQNYLDNATISGGGEVAIFGAEANGTGNNLRVGSVWAVTGNSAEVVTVDVEASSFNGTAAVGATVGNAQIEMVNGDSNITGEGSAVGAMASGLASYAGADFLGAKSEGNITFAGGKNLTASVQLGGAGAGAISGTNDSNNSGWAWASVEADVTGSGNISGNFWADTISNATAKANNASAEGTLVHLESHAENGTSSSNVDTTIIGGRFDAEMEAYAGNSTMASQKGHVLGTFDLSATAKSPTSPFVNTTHYIDVGNYDIKANAWTDDTGPYTTLVVI